MLGVLKWNWWGEGRKGWNGEVVAAPIPSYWELMVSAFIILSSLNPIFSAQTKEVINHDKCLKSGYRLGLLRCFCFFYEKILPVSRYVVPTLYLCLLLNTVKPKLVVPWTRKLSKAIELFKQVFLPQGKTCVLSDYSSIWVNQSLRSSVGTEKEHMLFLKTSHTFW